MSIIKVGATVSVINNPNEKGEVVALVTEDSWEEDGAVVGGRPLSVVNFPGYPQEFCLVEELVFWLDEVGNVCQS